jgi:hypothetical protein
LLWSIMASLILDAAFLLLRNIESSSHFALTPSFLKFLILFLRVNFTWELHFLIWDSHLFTSCTFLDCIGFFLRNFFTFDF